MLISLLRSGAGKTTFTMLYHVLVQLFLLCLIRPLDFIKNRSIWTRIICILAHNQLSVQKLPLVGHAYVKALDAKISKEDMNFKKNVHKFKKISYSGIIPFVQVRKEEILKYCQTRLVRLPLKSSDPLSLSVPSETIITPLTLHAKSPS